MIAENKPPVLASVALFLYQDNDRYIIMRRKGSHGAGTWGLPGGHIEFGESVKRAAVREALEELDVCVNERDVLIAGTSEAVFTEERKHYITVLCAARWTMKAGVPRIMELEKCTEIQWWKPSDPLLPGGLFLPLRKFLDNTPWS